MRAILKAFKNIKKRANKNVQKNKKNENILKKIRKILLGENKQKEHRVG